MKKIIVLIIFLAGYGSLQSQSPINNIYNPNNTWAAAFNVFNTDSGFVSCGTMGDSIV